MNTNPSPAATAISNTRIKHQYRYQVDKIKINNGTGGTSEAYISKVTPLGTSSSDTFLFPITGKDSCVILTTGNDLSSIGARKGD
jgi:hypothetical protein